MKKKMNKRRKRRRRRRIKCKDTNPILTFTFKVSKFIMGFKIFKFAFI